MHAYEKLLIARFAPSLVLVNHALEIVHTHGKAHQLLNLPEEAIHRDLISLLPSSLQHAFRDGIRQIRLGAGKATYPGIAADCPDGQLWLDLTFSPMGTSADPLVLIELGESRVTSPLAEPVGFAGQLLQQELDKDPDRHRQTPSGKVTADHESVMSPCGELLSSSRELRHTLQEGQTTDEGMAAVSEQLQEEIARLNELHTDLGNLFEATQAGALFVDRELKVRKFTPQVKTYFNLADSDIGRPLAQVAAHFTYPELLQEAGKVLHNLEPAEQEVPGREGQFYLIRLVPYQAPDGSVPGLVITLADISEFRKVHHSLLRLTDELRQRGADLERTEQCWQILVDNIPDSIVRYDRNLNVTFVNEGFTKETGVDPSEIMGRSAFSISSDLQRDDSWPRSIQQVLTTASVKEYTTTYVNNRGEQHYHAVMVPELSADGQEVESVLTISRNITSVRQYERQLRQSELLWRGLVDHTPDVISRYDSSLRLVFVNKAAEKEFGVPAKELLGRHPSGFSLRTANPQAFVDKLEAAFSTGQMQQHISETESSGEKKYFLSTIVPEWGESGSPETVLLISRNITDIKRTETELRETGALIRQQNDQLVKANEYLDNFVYAVAHDLRSPVANLTTLSRLLLKLDSGGKVQEYADFIHATVRRLDQTLNGLVEVLEVQSSFRIKLQEVVFEQVLREVTAEVAPLLETTPGRIEGDFTGCAGILYIPAYIASIFRNLISNSLKYRAEGRPPVVTITASRQEDEVLLEFRDNGMGIDLDRQGHKLFRPFSRLTTQAEGKGIGLHLIRSMIEKNGGRIEAESVVGSGTIFRCYLKEYNGQEIKTDEPQGKKPREISDTTQAAPAD